MDDTDRKISRVPTFYDVGCAASKPVVITFAKVSTVTIFRANIAHLLLYLNVTPVAIYLWQNGYVQLLADNAKVRLGSFSVIVIPEPVYHLEESVEMPHSLYLLPQRLLLERTVSVSLSQP